MEVDEGTLLKAYGLDDLQPRTWTDTEEENATYGGGTMVNMSELSAEEPDPLGLSGTIPIAKQVDKSMMAQVHLSSKLFDPKTFLSTIHPDATFNDLSAGNEYLKGSIGQRSEALKILVENNFDKFVAIKATTDGVYREMKESSEGPLREGNEHGVRGLKKSLANASAKADQVFMPVLENNLKTIKLRSTLSIFERSKFFFNLPGSLGEALEAGRYDQALRDYKRGKYLFDSKPGQLLNITVQGHDGSEENQIQQQQRIFAKVWDAVEATMEEMRGKLLELLKEPRRGVEEQEKTIEILLELGCSQDPVAVFLEWQHNHIRELMRKAYDSGMGEVEAAASVDQLVTLDEEDRAKDLQSCVRQLSLPEHDYERMVAVPRWRAILAVVRRLSETMVQTLPSFWRVCRNLVDGKLKSKASGFQGQARAWAAESVNMYISTLANFFHLTDVSILSRQPLSPLSSWVPAKTCSMTAGHFLKAILVELEEAVNDLKALKIDSTQDGLQSLIDNTKFCYVETLCQLWLEDAKLFHRLEDWTMNPEEEATTLFLGELAAFHSYNSKVAYDIACGKDNERTNPAADSSAVQPSAECTARIKGTFVDAIYAYLDGLVNLAFSEYNPLNAHTTTSQKVIMDKSKQAVVIDVKDLDTRILLGVTNLSRFSRSNVPALAKRFHEAYHVKMGDDLRTIDEVAQELDKILFNNFIQRKGQGVAEIFSNGILHSGIDWQRIPKPSGKYIVVCSQRTDALRAAQRSIRSSTRVFFVLFRSMPKFGRWPSHSCREPYPRFWRALPRQCWNRSKRSRNLAWAACFKPHWRSNLSIRHSVHMCHQRQSSN